MTGNAKGMNFLLLGKIPDTFLSSAELVSGSKHLNSAFDNRPNLHDYVNLIVALGLRESEETSISIELAKKYGMCLADIASSLGEYHGCSLGSEFTPIINEVTHNDVGLFVGWHSDFWKAIETSKTTNIYYYSLARIEWEKK